ncbi:histidinol-phosphate aminotransferase family protein, partial [Patescibacteria group bacterium]|nr:histidinol-phosphate aminotransferase family protein [Patescibacteria group bacterium]
MEDYAKEVMEVSKPKLEEFLKEKNVFFFQSQANFLLLRVPNPREIIEGLKGRGILVRPKNTPEGKEAVRISIGTLEDTNQLIKSLTEILS